MMIQTIYGQGKILQNVLAKPPPKMKKKEKTIPIEKFTLTTDPYEWINELQMLAPQANYVPERMIVAIIL